MGKSIQAYRGRGWAADSFLRIVWYGMVPWANSLGEFVDEMACNGFNLISKIPSSRENIYLI